MAASYRKKEQIGDCTLYLGDCIEVMPSLGKVDAVVTDPPYGIGEASKNHASRGKLASAGKYKTSNWDDKILQEEIDICRKISKNQIIFDGNYYQLPPTSCWLIWDKLNGASHFADCEMAWTNLKKAVRKFDFLWNGCMRLERHIDRVHPTQKPIALMKWCLSHLPDNCQTILDPFMGSGTTLVACAKMGRQGIGIEVDPDYFEIACKRVEDAYRQPDMFVQADKKYKQDGLL